jgi:hypothetical protein
VLLRAAAEARACVRVCLSFEDRLAPDSTLAFRLADDRLKSFSYELPFVFSCSLRCAAHSHFLSGPTSMNLLAFSLQTEHFF